jgi:adenylylsulfate kinase-like enzyme
MVLWLTGISGAGKTTIAQAIWRLMKPKLPALVMVDGDTIRDLFGASLGFHEAARYEQISRVQRLAAMLAAQDLPVIVAALYAHPDLMRWNRENLPGYVEVLVDAPLALVQQRDVKGLYAKAARGEMSHVVGVDVPWHRPATPDVVVDAMAGASAEDVARMLIRRVPRLAAAMDGGPA